MNVCPDDSLQTRLEGLQDIPEPSFHRQQQLPYLMVLACETSFTQTAFEHLVVPIYIFINQHLMQHLAHSRYSVCVKDQWLLVQHIWNEYSFSWGPTKYNGKEVSKNTEATKIEDRREDLCHKIEKYLRNRQGAWGFPYFGVDKPAILGWESWGWIKV